MEDNILIKVLQHVGLTDSLEKIEQDAVLILNSFKNIYSYIVYAIYKEDVLSKYTIQYVISQKEVFNTISAAKTRSEILILFAEGINTNKKIVD